MTNEFWPEWLIFCESSERAAFFIHFIVSHHLSAGIYSFDYCKGYKFVVSCGLSRRVVVWDPYRCREINTLSGHNASGPDIKPVFLSLLSDSSIGFSTVQKVLVNEEKHQIVSLSVDKIIKVWDVRNFKCIQTITNVRKMQNFKLLILKLRAFQGPTLSPGEPNLLSHIEPGLQLFAHWHQ